MNIRQFEGWMQRYEEEGIIAEDQIPIQTVKAVRSAKLIASSPEKRATQSAALLTGSLTFVQNPLFREVALPLSPPVPEWIKLKPGGWFVVSRAFWLAGYSKNVESYEQARQRAKQATDLLIGYALCYQKVVLVGHSFFNSMIAKELKVRGWIGPALQNREYWGCTTYKYNKALEGTGIKQGIGFTAI
ncbi:MAG: histidine phosphatase family protein [Ectobacillus sp.]